MQQLILALICITCLVASSFAHPSWGIVVDSAGNVYYVDVMHNFGTLWKIDSEWETITALTEEEFHAHSMSIDDCGDLWIGLNVYIEGVIEGDGHNYLVKYSPDEHVFDTLIFSDQGKTFYGGSIAYDQARDRVFFLNVESNLSVRSVKGGETRLLQDPFERLNAINTDRDGRLWIGDTRGDHGSLYILDSDIGLSQYARDLIPDDPKNPAFEERRFQIMYGTGISPDGNPVTTDAATRQVAEVFPDGSREVIYECPHPEDFPTGVFYRDGRYYIMEVGWRSDGPVGPNIVIMDRTYNILVRLTIDYNDHLISRSG